MLCSINWPNFIISLHLFLDTLGSKCVVIIVHNYRNFISSRFPTWPLMIHWRLLTILKAGKKSVWSNILLICKRLYILKGYSIHYTLRQNANVKKLPFGQNKRYRKSLFFLSRAPFHHSFTFDLRFLYELKRKVSLTLCVGLIFHFRFRFAFIFILFKFIFLLNKMYELFDI